MTGAVSPELHTFGYVAVFHAARLGRFERISHATYDQSIIPGFTSLSVPQKSIDMIYLNT